MRTDQVILKHRTGYDNRYAPMEEVFTAGRVVIFTSAAETERGQHKSSTVVYFFPRFSRLTDEKGNAVSFASAGIVPGDRLLRSSTDENPAVILKITPFLTGSDRVEHYRLECMA